MVHFYVTIKYSISTLQKNHVDDDDDFDMEEENERRSGKKIWKWYIIRQENTLPQLWGGIINSLTIYALFATPFVLVFPKFSNDIQGFEMFVDTCFFLDIIFNFFKLSET